MKTLGVHKILWAHHYYLIYEKTLVTVLLGFYVCTASRKTSGNDVVILYSIIFLIVTNYDNDNQVMMDALESLLFSSLFIPQK